MDNEFSNLNDLALAQGIKHSELIEEIHQAILSEFKSRYPDITGHLEVIVDEKNGDVRIMEGSSDITPKDFKDHATHLARQTIIKKLQHVQSEPKSAPSQAQTPESVINIGKWIAFILFWSYNALFIVLFVLFAVYFAIDPAFRSGQLQSFKDLGVLHSIFLILLILTPVGSILASLKANLARQPIMLLKLLFLIELPLIFLLLFAYNASSQVIPAYWFVLLSSILAFIVLYFQILKPSTDKLSLNLVRLTIEQIVVTTALYLTFLYSFYLPLIIGGGLKTTFYGLFESLIYSGGDLTINFGALLVLMILLVVGLIFIPFLALFFFAPFIISFLLLRLFQKTASIVWVAVGQKKALIMHCLLLLLYFGVFAYISYQPSLDNYMSKLEQLSQAKTLSEKSAIAKELNPHQDQIKKAYEDLSNARSRYFMVKGDDGLKSGYMTIFQFNDLLGTSVQEAFNIAAYPFIYQAPIKDYTKLYDGYYVLFGRDLYDYEYKSPNYVNLLSRKVQAATDYQNLLATVTIEESYQNTGNRNEEVLYEFSLPDNSVITDLKLGPDLQFNGQIAPRGAAAKTYQQELNRGRDPALLEQTGPRQYRLRVFPIPGKTDATLNGKNQKIQFSYVTPLSPQGFALPVYSQKTNIDENSAKLTATVNNQSIDLKADTKYLIAPNLNLTQNLCNLGQIIQARTQDSSASAELDPYNLTPVRDKLTCDPARGVNFNTQIQNKKIAILYDISSDNRDNTFFKDLHDSKQTQDLILSNSIDFYLFNDELGDKMPFTKELIDNPNIGYFGRNNLPSVLQKFNISQQSYDFVVIVTTSDPIDSTLDSYLPNYIPVYFIHNQNKVPSYTQNLTRTLAQSRGGVVETLDQAANLYYLNIEQKQLRLPSHALFSPFFYIDLKTNEHGLFISTYSEPAIKDTKPATDPNDPLSLLGAKAYLANRISMIGTPDNFEDYHQYAKKAGIISPYSSLISLVNDSQQQSLNSASTQYDSYTYQAPTPLQPPLLRSSSGFIGGGGSGGINLIPGRPMTENLMMPKLESDPGPVSLNANRGMSVGSAGPTQLLGMGSSLIVLFVVANVIIVVIAVVIVVILKTLKRFRKK